MLDAETIDHRSFLEAEHSLIDIGNVSTLQFGYGFQSDFSLSSSSAAASSNLDNPIGALYDPKTDASVNDLIEADFDRYRDFEGMSKFLNKVGNFSAALHADGKQDIAGFSGATSDGPADPSDLFEESQQDLFDVLNRSPSGQIQGSGTKGVSDFSGVSLYGTDVVTGLGNHQGSSETYFWGRIKDSISDEYSANPVGSVDSCDVISGLYAVGAALVCYGSGLTLCATAVGGAFWADKVCTTTEEELERVREEQRRAAQDFSGCPIAPDSESGVDTGLRTHPIDLSQVDVGQPSPEDGSFGPELTIPWHSYANDRLTLLDITGQPSKLSGSVRFDEKRAFTLDPVINPVPDEV